MDKNVIFELLIRDINKNKSKYTEEDIDLFNSIYESIIEMEVASSMFNNVSEPKLIELAIHTEDAARSRFNYLIALAKKRELKNLKII